MLPLSVVIITENEEPNIEDALRSVSDAREIVVVDAFSKDRTVDICRKYTDRVYQHEWEGFSRQKQKAVDYAQGPWILVLDADERVTPELRSEIISLLDTTEENGYHIPRENYFLGKQIRHGGWWPDYTLRLFRKEAGRFQVREVHEKVVVQGETAYLRSPLRHITYRSISDFVNRTERYSTLAAREMKQAGRRGTMLSLIVNPAATFFKMYVLRRGFLDGKHGLVLAMLYCWYTFLKYAKAWERDDEQ